ncbi:glycosyltransferase [Kineococcus gynurae]|uniref:Glycosyltransferase n=1 Tax=Kineococcus gynurae TaxID=452979 RepID=A0ABV5LUW8_9ACTN
MVPTGLEAPTGGNRYDRELLARLPVLTLLPVPLGPGGPGAPTGDATALDVALAARPDGSTVLLDGLVSTEHPDVLARHAHRLRTVLLLHLLRCDDDPAGTRPEAERASLRGVDVVVVTGRQAADRVRAFAGVAARLAPPGTDPGPPSTASGIHRLLSVGSVGPRKGQEIVARAVAELGAPWSLRCAGTVLTPFTLPGTTLLGPLDDVALEREWAAADLHVLLSTAEPYGMAVAEALARGLPSLVSEAGELPRLVGGAGIVVERDVAAVVSALRRWADDDGLRARLRAAARSRELPTWDETARTVGGLL